MESEKLPEFSEDGDHRNPEKMEETREPNSKRSYECVFCKRGFTNAQALGGHMNIHRKHRSNSKSSSSSKQLPNPNPNISRVPGPFHFEKSPHNVPDSVESSLKSKLSTNLDATSYLHTNYPIIISSSSLGENMGSDLSLQIGSSCPKNDEEDIAPNSDNEEEKDQDIDLELRLGRGHHP